MSTPIAVRKFFPAYSLPDLIRVRGQQWERLVRRVNELPETHPEHMAYTLMLTRMASAPGVDVGALCPVPTCALCAAKIVGASGVDDARLYDKFRAALDQIELFLGEVEALRVAA